MIHLGPTGRTKHTDDDRPVSPTVVAVHEVRHLRGQLAILRLVICVFAGAMLGWTVYAAVTDNREQATREDRIRACTAAMTASERLDGPLEPCESLSASERREAAYEYGRMKGLW